MMIIQEKKYSFFAISKVKVNVQLFYSSVLSRIYGETQFTLELKFCYHACE